ncbi:hypothetical protein ENSA5_14320 [Enhygromyxa salina]|uniref:Uncharacterized protein n=1 Tax=Enhygromyxa salina TaxID=215803 RepID=A0A2S9YER9_9BACT|nr:hypothetical protein [Enhygromyxa salina]PRQ03597.1 hypothetical protein ENSA5_14320 [Enhygromyxa salina]
MANQAIQAPEPAGPVEEHYYRRGDIDFCFLLNRTHLNLRVFDYRVGNYQQKRDFFDRIARSEGLKKVFTVVEKQDSKSWRSVGFSREGAIPGYFRTADAYVMSRVYTDDGDPIQGGAPKLTAPSISATEPNVTKPRGLNVEIVTDQTRLARVVDDFGAAALYAPFRRAVFHPDVAIHGKSGKRDFWIGAETDTSFGHAKVDILTPPRPNKDTDPAILEYLLQATLDELSRRETASVFSLIAADWTPSAQVVANLNFKVSARLTDHIVREDGFVGAQLWHRRITPGASPKLTSVS